MLAQFGVVWGGFTILGVAVLGVMLNPLLTDAFGGPTHRRRSGVASDSPSTPIPQDSPASTPQDTPVGDPQGFQADATPSEVGPDQGPMTRPTADDLTVTVRPPWRAVVLVLFLTEAGFTVLLGWLIWEPLYDRVAVFVVLGAVIAVIGVLQFRIRLEADLNGVVVANLFRRHTLNWNRVQAIDVETRTGKDIPTTQVLRFRVPEGDITSQAARQIGPLVEQLQDLQVAALQPRDGEPTGRAHHVPKLSAWQGWLIGLGVALSALVGLVMLIGEAPRRDTPVYSPMNLAIGDCFQADAVDTVVLDCAQPHDAEVYAVYDLPAGTERSEAAAFDAARDHCLDEFRSFAGVDNLADTALRAFGDWDGAEAVYCIAIAPDDVEGSLRGWGQ